MENNHVPRFDQVSKEYLADLDNNLRLTGGDSRFFYQAKIDHIQKLINMKPERILDFGCATGFFTNMLSDQFPDAQVIGYDPATECIKVAKKEIKENQKLKFVSRFDEITHQPDLVVSAGVFHHIPKNEKQSALNNVFNLIAPGGNMIVFEHNPLSPLTQIIVSLAAVDKGATLIRSGKLRMMFQVAGFQEIQSKYISFFPPFLKTFLPLEKYLEQFPLGAQHLVVGKKSK
jgi:2-polyprenyl-3-methyl-5-hydroxy-6-metoxy-1,4-benzoquinol methylase